jgi:transposase
MTKAELMAENEKLKSRIADLEQEVESLSAKLKAALAQLEAKGRVGKRQAAPFSKGKKKSKPKRPGRKKGHKPSHRAKPDKVDQELNAPLKQSCCLHCGGPLSEARIEQQYQLDIPPVEPEVTQFNIEVAHCTCCGRQAQGRHPNQISDGLGPTAIHFGPRVLGLAAEMKHALGVPYRKVCHILAEGFGFNASAGGLARAGQRLAHKAEPTYDRLVFSLRQQEVVYADETGWKIDGDNAWLWVFTSEQVTLYTIDPRRAGEVAERILGRDFEGVLTCDCLLAYNPLPYRQQKCLAHLLRRCADIADQPRPDDAIHLSQQVACLLRGAIKLKHQKDDHPPWLYHQACTRLEQALDRLLETAGEPDDEAARRLVNLLGKQRHRLFTFLYNDPVQPTNNAAERAIRPAVIVRKTSAGNRSDVGAKTHAIITSLWQTCQQQGRNFLAVVTELLRQPTSRPISLVPASPASIPSDVFPGSLT